jgi:hypothetical protein
MTLPVVTEIAPALQPVEPDDFLEPAERTGTPASWCPPRRRPEDA